VKTYSEFPVEAAMAVFSLPFWLPLAAADVFRPRDLKTHPFRGLWESVAVGRDGHVNRLRFGEDRYIAQSDFLWEGGRYRLEDGIEKPHQLMEWEKDLDRTYSPPYPPIVGRWAQFTSREKREWFPMPDGSFHIEAVTNERSGK
jgi:hypothetical protein